MSAMFRTVHVLFTVMFHGIRGSSSGKRYGEGIPRRRECRRRSRASGRACVLKIVRNGNTRSVVVRQVGNHRPRRRSRPGNRYASATAGVKSAPSSTRWDRGPEVFGTKRFGFQRSTPHHQSASVPGARTAKQLNSHANRVVQAVVSR